MNSLLRKRITLFCLIFALLSVIWWLLRETYVLRCINRTQHKVFFSKTMSPGDPFTFKFIHSVQKTPVYEIFTIDQEGNIILVETRVMSLGYGLPAPTQKDHYRIENDFLVITDMNRKIGRLLIRVNFVRLMELNFGKKVFDLRRCGRAGDLIEVSTTPEKRITTIVRNLGDKESGSKEYD